MDKVPHRPAAILVADIVDGSRPMQADEAGTLAGLQRYLADQVGPRVAGRPHDPAAVPGDGVLAEFPSTVDAVRCALGLLADQGTGPDADGGEPGFLVRVGISVGDVTVDAGGDVFGQAADVAAA
jgi:adenylate cyclase